MVSAGLTTRDLNELIADPNPDFSTLTDFEKRVWKATHRTPEEIDASRARVEANTKPGRPLPIGKTLEDVMHDLFAHFPADPMTDAEVIQALREI